MENRAIMIDPSGVVVWDYAKANPTPGESGSIAPGPGTMPTVDTPYGRIATVICYDADFAAFMRQAGRARVDLLLDPSLDWNEVKVTHDQMATLRAIENGVSLVRATSMGLSSAVDYRGQQLASIDYFKTDTPVLVTLIPTHGTSTNYTYIGDIFAYLCVISLIALIGVALWRRSDTSIVTEAPVNVVR
jgi:apolipoprotein N-acyltransferase